MNKQTIVRRLLAFAMGAILLVIGDYLYGTTYYTDQPTRFLVAACWAWLPCVTICTAYSGTTLLFTKKVGCISGLPYFS